MANWGFITDRFIEAKNHRHAERSPDVFYRDEVEACSVHCMLRLHLDPKAVEIPLSMTWVHCSNNRFFPGDEVVFEIGGFRFAQHQ